MKFENYNNGICEIVNGLSNEFCDELVEFFDSNYEKHTYKEDYKEKESNRDAYHIDFDWNIPKHNEIYNRIGTEVQKSIIFFREHLFNNNPNLLEPFFAPDFINVDLTYLELVKYLKGSNRIKLHADGIFGDNINPLSCIRTCSIICYLNDNPSGLHFPLQNFKTECRKGSIIFFPVSGLFPHGTNNIISEDRYCIVTWLRVRPFNQLESKGLKNE